MGAWGGGRYDGDHALDLKATTERPSPELAVHCPRSAYRYGTFSALHLKRTRVERLDRVPDAAIGPPPEPDSEIAPRCA